MSRRSPNLESWNPMEEDFENVGFNSYRGGTCIEPSDFSMAAQGGKMKKNFDYQLVQLHVNKIPAEMDEKGLAHLFAKFGRVLKAKIIHPKGISGPKFVFGKVEYESVKAALAAIETYHLKPPLNLDIQLDRQCFVNGEMPVVFQNVYNNRGETDSGFVRRALLPTPSSHNAHSYDGTRISEGRSSRVYGSNQGTNYKQMGIVPLPITVTTVPGASYDRKVNFSHEAVGNKATVRVMNSTFSGKNSPGRIQRNAEICIKCNKPGSFRCGTCKAVYCSIVCQKEDWPKHKFICIPSDRKKGAGLLTTPDKFSHRAATHFASHSEDVVSEHVGKTVGSATQTSEHKHHLFEKKNEHGGHEQSSSFNRRQPKNEMSSYGNSHVSPKCKQAKDRPNHSVSKSIQTDMKQSREEIDWTANVQEVGTATDRMPVQKELVTVAVQAEKNEEIVEISGRITPKVNKSPTLSEAPAHVEKEKGHNKDSMEISHKNNEKLLCQKSEEMPRKANEEIKVESCNVEVSYKELEKVHRKESEEVQNKNGETAPRKEIVNVPKNGDDTLTLAVGLSSSASALTVCQTAPKPKRITLPTDHPVQVVVTHASTPHSFYVQLLDKTDLTAVMCKLQSVEDISPPESVHMNQFVAAKFSFDDVWYRAKVEKVNGDQVTVQYIDYGNTESVSLQNVRHVSPEFFVPPIQCAWCRLANIEPFLGKWSDDAVESFSACVCDVPLYASVTTTKSCGDLQCVTLSDRESGGADRGELMIFTNLATHSLPIHYNAVGKWKEDSEVTLFMPFLERSGIIFAMDKSAVSDEDFTDILSALAFDCDELENKGNEAITVGSLVAAKSAYDGSWYRAVVTGTAAAGWKVRYLDFGNSEEVSVIHLLPEKFAQNVSLSVCFEVDDIYMRECVPEEFTEDHCLIVTVKEIRGDTAIVDVKIKGEHCVFPAIASSIWKMSFEDTPDAGENADLVDDSASSVPSACQNLGILPDSSLPVPSISSPQSSTPKSCIKAKQSPANAHVPVRKLPETPIPMEEVGVFPVLIEAVDKVYFQVLNDETCEQLKELQEELNTKVLNEPFDKLDCVPSVGDIVCAMFTDNSWYRGVVKTVHSPNDIGIYYIDFGNVDSTALENLRRLPDRYCGIPPLSLMVSPSGVHPECTVTQLRDVFTKERDCVWQMKVVDHYCVPVKVNLTLNGKTLVEVLGEELSSVNVQTEETSDVAVVANEALTQSCSPLVEKAPEVKPSNSPSITFGDMPMVEFPVGSTVVVIITEVKSPEMIFCCLYNTEDISKYDLMATEMTSYAIKTGVSDVFALKENEICLAKSSLDDVFYRAMLLEQRSSEMNVFFIDYGSVETISNKDVRPVPESFLKLPVQANQCIMHGLKSTVGYSEERCQEFKDIVKVNEMHDVEVVSKDSAEGYYYIRIPSLEKELRAKGFLALQ